MCGIVSLCYGADNDIIGREGGALLKRLEYRGYDSTGGAFVNEAREITLLKAVGAPSKVVPDLRIDRQHGQRFIGQVRWATYGAVTQENCQPHQMNCTLPFLGAHNGNISNTDTLKTFLTEHGHSVVSDNDGEMIVHLTEHYYALAGENPDVSDARAALDRCENAPELPESVLLLIAGARQADAQAEGSYAAAFCDPASPGVVAVKSGSSLYAGLGADEAGEFVVVSSDLTSVLSKTRMLIPLAEGEGIWFDEHRYLIFPLAGELDFAIPRPRRSKLNVRDTGLREGFSFYLDQEIASVPDNLDDVARYYLDDPETTELFTAFEATDADANAVLARLTGLYETANEGQLVEVSQALLTSPELARLRQAAGAKTPPRRGELVSEEAALLTDVERLHPEAGADIWLLDLLVVWSKQRWVSRALHRLVEDIRAAQKAGGRVFLVASGTSYHAALTGAYFFNGLAQVGVFPVNPGMFRSMYLNSLTPTDLLIGITQSGETKDLVDIYLDAAAATPGITRVSLVNNENSRIPQELSEYYLPLLCGPEIAVAATKSFVNQLAVLFALACAFEHDDADIRARLMKARELVVKTLETSGPGLEEAAERLYLEPSLHLLGASLNGLAREGALKIREVVLNHAEGYDAAEFKHGPNTILGKNTLFSISDLAAILDGAKGLEGDGLTILREHPELVEDRFANYPLVFICPPDERDIRITVSQIHTHKIRGADIFLLGEPSAELRAAVEGVPAGVENYWARVLELPVSGDEFLFVFSASVALQRLAFRMSEMKMHYLDELGVAEHGVHPDAPKNVSKSITVD